MCHFGQVESLRIVAGLRIIGPSAPLWITAGLEGTQGTKARACIATYFVEADLKTSLNECRLCASFASRVEMLVNLFNQSQCDGEHLIIKGSHKDHGALIQEGYVSRSHVLASNIINVSLDT